MPRSTAKGGTTSFALVCETESGIVLSSELEREAWDANETLVKLLLKENGKKDDDLLFSWKKLGKTHLASSKETYSWRGIIDSIKAANLEDIHANKIESAKRSPLIKSKPIMLRVAGEITNSLLHSYNYRHRIAFIQCDSTRPSSVPT
jgi:hypothetical protein